MILPKENIHYKLIPSENPEENWHIRILVGPYTETIIQFDTIQPQKKSIKFNYSIISSPVLGLKEGEPELIKAAHEILTAILIDIEREGYKGEQTSE